MELSNQFTLLRIYLWNLVSIQQKRTTFYNYAAPSGRILYIGPCYYGYINDNEMVRRTFPEWLFHLNYSKQGLGDSGFQGMREQGFFQYLLLYTSLQNL